MFQSLSREKPFCHSPHGPPIWSLRDEFQSLSREKPFCHASFHFDRSHAGAVSIAQSRKALLPRYYTPSFVLESHAFQSLSREKPFCHCLFRFVNESKLYSFN